MTKLQKAMYRALRQKRFSLMRLRGLAITGHEKSSHILADIQDCTHAMMKMEVGE